MASLLFPRFDTLQSSFGTHPLTSRRGLAPRAPASSAPAAARAAEIRPELCVAYSVVDDAKAKASQLSAEAAAEFDKAAAAAKKPKHIELFSGEYYAACTLGGMMACVGLLSHPPVAAAARLTAPTGPDPHRRDPA